MRTIIFGERLSKAAPSLGVLALISPLLNPQLPKEDFDKYFKFLTEYPISKKMATIKRDISSSIEAPADAAANLLTPVKKLLILYNIGAAWPEHSKAIRHFHEITSGFGRGLAYSCLLIHSYFDSIPAMAAHSDFRNLMSELVAESLGIKGAPTDQIEDLKRVIYTRAEAFAQEKNHEAAAPAKNEPSVSSIFRALKELVDFAMDSNHKIDKSVIAGYYNSCTSADSFLDPKLPDLTGERKEKIKESLKYREERTPVMTRFWSKIFH